MFGKKKRLKEMFSEYDFEDSTYGSHHMLIGKNDVIFIDKWSIKKILSGETQPERATQIDDLEVYQDGKSIKCGNSGKVLVGGITFGLLGALVGASMKHKEIDYVTSLGLNIYANGKCYQFPEITSKQKKDSVFYRLSITHMNNLRAKLLPFMR